MCKTLACNHALPKCSIILYFYTVYVFHGKEGLIDTFYLPDRK